MILVSRGRAMELYIVCRCLYWEGRGVDQRISRRMQRSMTPPLAHGLCYQGSRQRSSSPTTSRACIVLTTTAGSFPGQMEQACLLVPHATASVHGLHTAHVFDVSGELLWDLHTCSYGHGSNVCVWIDHIEVRSMQHRAKSTTTVRAQTHLQTSSTTAHRQ